MQQSCFAGMGCACNLSTKRPVAATHTQRGSPALRNLMRVPLPLPLSLPPEVGGQGHGAGAGARLEPQCD